MAVIKEMIRQVETDHKGKLEQITNMQQEHKYVIGPALWLGIKFIWESIGVCYTNMVMTLFCNNILQNIVGTIWNG